jgi:hypothetical protein
LSRRSKRLLIRLGIGLVVLSILAFVAFAWIAYNPLEGSVRRVAALVPDEVDFVYETSWSRLKESAWLRDNVLEHPLIPGLEEQIGQLERGLEQLREQEAQINGQIPLGIATFSFERDVVPDKIVTAGRWCSQSGPERGLPRWRELLVLTRVSWKAKFFAALKHGFVRSRLGPGLTVDDLGGGVFRFTIHTIRPSPERDRQVCGPGEDIPPENVWYGFRERDVLAFANSERLIRGVAYVAEFPDSGRAFVDRPHVKLEVPGAGVAAAMDLRSMEYYLLRSLEQAGPPFTILNRFLNVSSLDKMNGYLAFPSPDRVHGRAEVVYRYQELRPEAQDVYALPPEPTRSGIPSIVPAKDTFLVLLLRTPPLHLIKGIYEDILSPGDRRLWEENLRRMGTYRDIYQFFAEFAERLGDSAGIAVGRVSEVFDRVEYPEWYSDPTGNPDAGFEALASTFVVRLRRGTSPEQLDAYLKERIPLLGASEELERVDYRGLSYTKLRLRMDVADFALVKPAYILAQDHFIFCTNESYFRRILDTLVDPRAHPPLSADPNYLAVADQLLPELHVALFVDLEKLLRVPPSIAPGGQPRGYLWDRRNLWVINARDTRLEANRYRAERLRQAGSGVSREERARIDDDVDRHIAAWIGRYEEFLEEYRRTLEGYRRLRAVGAGITGDRRMIRADLSFLVHPP